MSPSPSPAVAPDLEAYMAAAAALMGLRIDQAWRAPILANLRVLQAAAALVEDFPLTDEADVAPVFEA